MKNLLLFIFLTSIFQINAQLPVSQTAENKNVVLEEFTGIHCPYCPDGHKRAQQIYDTHPDDVVLINIHTGSYANPSSGEPDFRTPFGSAIAGQSNLAGYPAGTINRHYFGHSQSGAPSGATALGRGQWASDANTILTEASYVNVALEATIDVQTREMTINVEVYYTGDSPQNSNFLNVALLQNNVEGPQAGSSLNPDQVLPNGNYNHMHMLRHLITGQWGDEITTTTQGTLVQKQYTYMLPTDINGVPLNLGDIEIAAFVAEGHQEIISGSLGTINYTNLPYTTNVALTDISVTDNICSPTALSPKITLYNNGSETITEVHFSYNVNGGTDQTYIWTGQLNSLGSTMVNLPEFNFGVNASNTLNVNLTSINGNPTDENNSDNTITVNFNETPYAGDGAAYIVTIVQDQYGSETTWAILNENNDVVNHGGPYSNLSNSGTLTHEHNVLLDSDGCYTFVILDSYGDGINGGYGNGSYSLKQADGTVVFTGNGVFTSEESKYFNVSNTAAVNSIAFDNLKLYPNPTQGLLNVSGAANMKLSIIDVKGVVVYQFDHLSNQQQIDISGLSNGVYFAKFERDNQVNVQKIVMNK